VLQHLVDGRGQSRISSAQGDHRDGGAVTGDRPGDDESAAFELILLHAGVTA